MARTVGSNGEKTRNAITRAASALIARYGFEAVSMRKLASDVGVQAAALYRYFPNKEALLFELMHEHMVELHKSLDDVLNENDAPIERIRAFVRNHIDFHLENRDSTQVSNMELRSLSEERLLIILQLRNRYEERLRAILRDGGAAGTFCHEDDRLTSMAIIQMITGVIVWFRPDERLSLIQITSTYEAMTMRLIGATT